MRRLILLAAITFAACNTNNSNQSNAEEKQATVNAPAFSADTAYAAIEKQVAFGPRIPGTPAQEACAAWLISYFKNLADTVYVQRTKVIAPRKKELPCINIIASFNPAAKNRVLLFSHWDTRPFADKDAFDKKKQLDGADDGASGVGVLMEVARQFHAKKPAIGVDILLTDVEDYGESDVADSYCLGTQYWVKNPHIKGYAAQYGILLDMVGGRNSSFYMEGNSKQYAYAQMKMFWDVANTIGYSDLFRYEESPEGPAFITDDHYYVNTLAKIPSFDIIATQPKGDFMPHHHTANDNMSVIDRKTLQGVGQTILHVIYGDPFNY